MAQHDGEEKTPLKVTDIDALKNNVRMAVEEFAERWISMPGFGLDVEVMSVSQLRDAMGLRASIDWGDPWPAAEQELIVHGFRWHWLGGQRVMYLREREDFVPDTGWSDAEEVEGMKDFTMKGPVRFACKRDAHPRKGQMNWWENMGYYKSKTAKRQKLKKDIERDL